MCGISGFLGKGTQQDLEAMTAALYHRGPDGCGYYSDAEKALFLGHRRLAIRDVSGGAQPMWNADKSLAIIYNGEIYNDDALRRELIALGYSFRTSHADTEVLLHGYAAWGEKIAEKLNGMFAFVIYDVLQQRLYMARDRFGEKPFYYAATTDLFAFSSELSALKQHHALQNLPLCQRALVKFFGYGYVPAPLALYEKTAKLPAGCYMTVQLATLEKSITCYWQFTLQPEDSFYSRSEENIAEELRFLITQAVQRRLVSDVPLGVFLSGGIDSAAILAGIAQHLPAEKIHSFTIGFTEKSYDESQYAAAVAAYFGTTHHQRIVDTAALETVILKILTEIDEPLADPSLIPTYLLSCFTREKVTVALSGDGGDELFAGYDPFKALGFAQTYQKIVPKTLHRVLERAVHFLPYSSKNMSIDFKMRRALQGMTYPEQFWEAVWLAPLNPQDALHLFQHPLPLEEVYSEVMEVWESGSARTRLERMLQFFTKLYLQNNILAKVDRAAMQASLETRAVFLDNDLVDFCQRLPASFKYRHGQRKYILKKALAPLLPPEVLQRRKKGFGVPLRDWLQHIPPQLPLTPIAGINTEWVAQAWQAQRQNKQDNRLFLWAWLSLQRNLFKV